jgi:hypothetical protein
MPVQVPRIAKIIGAPVGEANDTHVQALIDAHVPEDADLDYKRANEYITGNDGADELSKDVTGMANARGGLIVIGIEEDERACAKDATPVPVNDAITGKMWQILRSRVVPWLDAVEINQVSLTDTPDTGYYLISVGSSPLAPHAVRTLGSSKPRYAFARRDGTQTRWLEETEIATAYRNRFRIAEEHSARARQLFDENPTPTIDRVGAEAAWVELAIIPAGLAEKNLDMTFVRRIQTFLTELRPASPAPWLLLDHQPTIARRRVRFDSGQTYLDFHTDGAAFIRAHIGWRHGQTAQPLPVRPVFLEYQVLGTLHLAVSYTRWVGGYGDVDILARTHGYPAIFLQGEIASGPAITRMSDSPTQVTVPLDAINDHARRTSVRRPEHRI